VCRQRSWRWSEHQSGSKCVAVGINIIPVKRLEILNSAYCFRIIQISGMLDLWSPHNLRKVSGKQKFYALEIILKTDAIIIIIIINL